MKIQLSVIIVCLALSTSLEAMGQIPQEARRRRTLKSPPPPRETLVPVAQPVAPPKEKNLVSGKVFDSETGEALMGAAIQTVGQNYGAYADENGRFQFRLPADAPETVEIEVSFVGYHPARFTVPKDGGAIECALQFEILTIDATVVITASRIPQRVLDAPVTIHVVTARDIEMRNRRFLADLLRDNIEYKIDNGSEPGNYNSVTTRGIRGMEKFLLLQDGLRISSPTNEPLVMGENFPLYMVKQVEMVSSSASALYGADALSGVINLVTYKPEEIDGVRAGLRTGLYHAYGGYALAGKQFGKVGFRLGASYFYDGNESLPKFYPDEYKSVEDYRTGTFNTIFGPISPGVPYDSVYQYRRTGYNIDGLLTVGDFRLAIVRHSARIPGSSGYYPSNAIYNHSVFQEQSVTKVSATHEKSISERVSLATTAMVSTYELNPKSNFRNVFSGLQPGYKFAFGMMGYLEQVVNLSWTKVKFTGGVVYQPYQSTPKGEDLDRPVRPARSTKANILGSDVPADFFSLRYDNFGAFAQAIYKPTEKWAFTVGARLDYNTRYQETFNPRAGVVFTPTQNTSLKVFYGSAFYAPSPLDAYEQFGAFVPVQGQNGQDSSYKSFFRHLPNPDLQPIINRNLEFNFSQNIGDFRIGLTAYVLFISNLYSESNDAETGNRYNGMDKGYSVDFIEVRVNNGRQTNYGGHMDFQYRTTFGPKMDLVAYTRFGYINGEEEFFGVKRQIPYISEFQNRTGVQFRYDKFSVFGTLVAMSAQRTIRVNEENIYKRATLPGYHTVELNASYQILPFLRVFVEFENLTFQKYFHPNHYDTGADFFGVPQAPFRFFGGLDVNFDFKRKTSSKP